MARLPIPDGDIGTWGNVLNEFLLVSHNNDGAIKDGATPPCAIGVAGPADTKGLQTILKLTLCLGSINADN